MASSNTRKPHPKDLFYSLRANHEHILSDIPVEHSEYNGDTYFCWINWNGRDYKSMHHFKRRAMYYCWLDVCDDAAKLVRDDLKNTVGQISKIFQDEALLFN